MIQLLEQRVGSVLQFPAPFFYHRQFSLAFPDGALRPLHGHELESGRIVELGKSGAKQFGARLLQFPAPDLHFFLPMRPPVVLHPGARAQNLVARLLQHDARAFQENNQARPEGFHGLHGSDLGAFGHVKHG